MKHEKETLESVVALRNHAMAANTRAAGQPGDPAAMQALGGAETALGLGAMTKFMAVAEAYPDLKANTNMMALQEELTSTGKQGRVRPARV